MDKKYDQGVPGDPEQQRQRIFEVAAQLDSPVKLIGDLEESNGGDIRLLGLLSDAVILTRQGKILFANTSALMLHGATSSEQLIGKNLLDLVHPHDRESTLSRMSKLRAGEREPPIEQKRRRLDGSTFVCESRGSLVNWEGELAVVVILRDLTEQKRAEAVLRDREMRLQAVMDNAADGIITIDERGRLESTNPAACGIFGYSVDEMIGKNVSMLMPEPDRSLHDSYLKNYLGGAEGKIVGQGMRVVDARRKDGSIFPIGLSVGQMCLEGKRLFIGTVRDISKKVEAERTIRESEEKLRKIFEATGIGILIRSFHDDTVISNNGICKLLGYSNEELRAIYLTDITHPDDAKESQRLRAELLAGAIDSYQITKRYIRKDGKPIWVVTDLSAIRDDHGNVSCTICLFQDLTLQKHAEEQLLQAQKMDSLGTLAGGVAHELNNMLLPIQGLTELAMEDVPEDSRTHKNLSVALKSATRAGELVEKILSFSHQVGSERKPVSLRSVIEEEMQLLGPALPATIKRHVELDENPVTVLADETQIHQILMNLASNAAHAMSGKVGELTIRLSPIDLQDDTICARLGLEPGAYAKLSVQDTGHGMDKRTKERIFDPFFTTKEVGEGTGMGLSMIHGIVTSHGGAIDVSSEAGLGTTFDIYLPLAEDIKPALAAEG